MRTYMTKFMINLTKQSFALRVL